MTKALTDNAQNVLNAIATGKSTKEAVGTSLNMTAASVGGSVRALQNRGLVDVTSDGTLALTPDASEWVTARTRKARTGTKAEMARKIFQRYGTSNRQKVLEKFEHDIGLTPKGAITYYQNMRKEAGLAPMSRSSVASRRGAKLQKMEGAAARQ